VKFALEHKQAGHPEDWKPQFLVDNDSWWAPYFDPADRKAGNTRRQYFGGPMTLPS
jgi:hypothetical protein